MLRSLCKALKAEEQVTADIRDRATQAKVTKPGPRVGTYPPRIRRGNFPLAKGYFRGGDGLPSQGLLQQPGMVNGEVNSQRAHPGPSDPGSQHMEQGRAGPCSHLASSRSELIKLDKVIYHRRALEYENVMAQRK